MSRPRDKFRVFDSGSQKRKAKKTKDESEREILSKTPKINALFQKKSVERKVGDSTTSEPCCSSEKGNDNGASAQVTDAPYSGDESGDTGCEGVGLVDGYDESLADFSDTEETDFVHDLTYTTPCIPTTTDILPPLTTDASTTAAIALSCPQSTVNTTPHHRSFGGRIELTNGSLPGTDR